MLKRILHKAKSWLGSSASSLPHSNLSRPSKKAIIPRSEHGISRKEISDNTLKVLYRLKNNGFQAYLVGGGVRDLLLRKSPKDFDVVTDAKPEQVKNLFTNCRLIGRRFRLAHVHFGRDIVEVATFRKQVTHQHEEVRHSSEGMILRDNVYGTLEEDVWRRDFTVNALYYNIKDFSIIDYTEGMRDLKNKTLRMIGDSETRYREDPVRILRAIRFASKLEFHLSEELAQPISKMKGLLQNVPPARLFEEVIKLFHSGASYNAYELLLQYDLFPMLFEQTHVCLQQQEYPTHQLLSHVFKNTDSRINSHKGVTPVFIIAALLWHPIVALSKKYMKQGNHPYHARVRAIEHCLSEQSKSIAIPKRLAYGARDIWLLQSRMQHRSAKRVDKIMAEPRFKAAYDFMLIRAEVNEPIMPLAQWWQSYFESDLMTRQAMLKKHAKKTRRKKEKHDE